MLGRFITLAAILAAGSIAVGSMATRQAGNAAAAADHSNDNWTTQPRTHGGGMAASTRSSSGEVRLGRAEDSHFYADADVNGTNIRMMVDSGASIIALTRRDAEAIADGGWLGMTIPEEYGGGGLGVTEASIVEYEISASGGGMNACSAACGSASTTSGVSATTLATGGAPRSSSSTSASACW